MRTLKTRSRTLDSLPGAGGSGGGPNRAVFTPPEPQGILGINSVVVYGGNFQMAFPINVQMAVGSNLQICINPAAFGTLYGDGDTSMPPFVNQIIGSGIGGNMQLTMGCSTNFVMGQSFDINLGPRRIQIDVHNKTAIHEVAADIGGAIIVVVTVFLIAYGLTKDDDARSIFLMVFQFLMQCFLMLLMDTENLYSAMEDKYQDALNQVFGKDDKHPNAGFKDTWGHNTLGAVLAGLGEVAAVVLPIVLEAIGESKLDTPEPPEAVVDSSGNQIGTVKDS